MLIQLMQQTDLIDKYCLLTLIYYLVSVNLPFKYGTPVWNSFHYLKSRLNGKGSNLHIM